MSISKNRATAIAFSLILMFAMAGSLGALPNANAQYNEETQDAIDAGMYWDLPQDASDTRLLMWERYGDEVPADLYRAHPRRR